MIDLGFVFGAFLPCKLLVVLPNDHRGAWLTIVWQDVIAAAARNTNYSVIWRTSLGIGVAFPLVLFLLRLRLKEPEEFQREAMRRQTPYLLVLKFYWFRLLCVSLVWFLYNVSAAALFVSMLSHVGIMDRAKRDPRSSPSTLSVSTLPRF